MNSKHAGECISGTEQILDAIEASLEAQWDAETIESLPDELSDPIRVMERGRKLLAEGLVFSSTLSASSISEDEFRIAARNGKPIPDSIRSQMHADRDKTESQDNRLLDESK